MDKKKQVLLLILTLIIVLGGAYLLYSKLGDATAPSQLSVQSPEKESDSQASSQNKSPSSNESGKKAAKEDAAEKQDLVHFPGSPPQNSPLFFILALDKLLKPYKM